MKNIIINSSHADEGFIKLHISGSAKAAPYESVDQEIKVRPGQSYGGKSYDQLMALGKSGKNEVVLRAGKIQTPKKGTPKKKAK